MKHKSGRTNAVERMRSLKLSVTDEFAIMATMRTNKPPEGYLFAIVNSLDTVTQLGVRVLSDHNVMNVSLVYNDPLTKLPIDSIVTFSLPYEPKHWINFAIQVMNDRVSIYHNCLKVQEINVTKDPKTLVFESASTFYLAQAGNSKEKFEVSSAQMRWDFIGICQPTKRFMDIFQWVPVI